MTDEELTRMWLDGTTERPMPPDALDILRAVAEAAALAAPGGPHADP